MQQAFAEHGRAREGRHRQPDEKRMVGHYWLRAPAARARPGRSADEITSHADRDQGLRRQGPLRGRSPGPKGNFTHLLVIGIGGSALGPQFVSHALGPAAARTRWRSISSTTPIPTGSTTSSPSSAANLAQTLVVVISKSGGTLETRNGQLEAAAAFKAAGLSFPRALRRRDRGRLEARPARAEGGLARPLPDVGLGRRPHERALRRRPPAGRAPGLDIDAMLAGAAAMDAVTRRHGHRARTPPPSSPSCGTSRPTGAGAKDMVVLPYKDRLLLFSRYLQQLVMESLGKELDLAGQGRQPGHRGLRQQGLDRPARLRPAAARGREELLRHLHRGA